MLITIFSVIVAALFLFYPFPQPLQVEIPFISQMMVVAGSIVLLILPFLYCIPLSSLLRLEQQLIPRLMAVFRRDRLTKMAFLLLFLFPFVSYLLAATLNLFQGMSGILFAIWMISFGLTLDLIRYTLRRLTNFLNPFYVTDTFKQEATKAIQDNEDTLLWSSIDNLTEVALRAIQDNRLALATQTLSEFPPIFHAFFASAKSISHTQSTEEKAIKQATGLDEASFTLLFFLQKLELINDHALAKRLESISRHAIVGLGKIIIYAAKLDLSLVSFPTYILGNMAVKAQQNNFGEVAALATSTLYEVAQTIINEVDLTYAELQEPFFAIANNLATIAQATFKKDKNINIAILIQPIKDLKALFQSEKMASHRDTPAIVQQIDGILAEFDALEQVMKTIPTIPTDLKK